MIRHGAPRLIIRRGVDRMWWWDIVHGAHLVAFGYSPTHGQSLAVGRAALEQVTARAAVADIR